MKCPNCGYDEVRGHFCPNCGFEMSLAAEPAPASDSTSNLGANTAPQQKTAPAPKTTPAQKAAPAPKSAPAQKAANGAPKKKSKAGLAVAISLVSVVLIVGLIWGITALLGGKEPVVQFTVASIDISDRDVPTDTEFVTQAKVVLAEGENIPYFSIVNEKGKKFGKVNDRGEEGDDIAGDGIYTGEITLTSKKAEPMKLFASYKEVVSEKSETVYFYPEFTDDYYYGYQELKNDLDNLYWSYSDLESAHNAALELLEEKKREDVIESFEFDGTSITVTFPFGSAYIYSYNPEGIYKSSVGNDNGELDDPETEGLYTISPNLNNILTLQPYSYELGGSNVDSAAHSVAGSDYAFIFRGNMDNGDVSVELMKNLDQYNLIILDGHGGYSPTLHSFFGIGTPVTDYNDRDYWADLYYNRLVRLSGGQYGVTAAFFERYYDSDDFGDSLVYLGCCHGADDSVLADTLISKGVDAVFAYRNSVTVSYDSKMVRTIFEEMAREGDTPVTVADALQIAKNQHGEVDNTFGNWYNWLFGNYEDEDNRAKLELFGKTDFSLDMKNSSLRGKVADSLTGEYLANAYITTHTADKGEVYIKTDESGNFSLPLTPGVYNIKVRANGYLDCVISNVKIEENSTTYLQNTIMLEQKADDTVSFVGGSVTNAVTGNPVVGASISFRENYNQLVGEYVTDENGQVITVISNEYGEYYTESLPYGYYTAEISMEGFATQYVNVIASDDTSLSLGQGLLIAPEASGNDFRITLEWEENPRDEDAHIVGSYNGNYFHVYYASQSYYDYNYEDVVATLDHDDTQGNGFETITLTVDPQGTYHYYVHHFAGYGNLSTSNAIVKVYQGGVMIKQYNVPIDQGTGIYWNVFSIENGKVISVNRIASTPLGE